LANAVRPDCEYSTRPPTAVPIASAHVWNMPAQNARNRAVAIRKALPVAEFGIHRVNTGFNDNK